MKQRVPTIVGVVGGASFLLFGIWAMVAPESFFDRVALFEPLGAVLLLASLAHRLDTLTVALLGTGVGAAAHAVSHVIGRDLGGRPASDIPTFVVLGVLLLGTGLWQRTRTSG